MNLGYACLNVGLNQKGISSSKGMVRRTFFEKGLRYASQLALQNVQALLKMWNGMGNITLMFFA